MAEPVSIEDVEALRETEKALLVQFDNQEMWVPKAVITDDSEVYQYSERTTDGRSGTLVLVGWWAKKQGLV